MQCVCDCSTTFGPILYVLFVTSIPQYFDINKCIRLNEFCLNQYDKNWLYHYVP